MSLIKCPECGKDVSSNASSCPNCGHPLSAVVDFQLSLVSGHKVDVKSGTLSVFDDHGICISTDSISNYTLQFYKMQAPAVGDIYLEVIFSHPSLVSPIVLKANSSGNDFNGLKEFLKILKNYADVDIVSDRRATGAPSPAFRFKTGRLVVGIISIVPFVLVSFQSCAAGISNTLSANGATSGTSGFILAVFMLTAGIVGICTKNTTSKVGPIVCTVFYWLGSLVTIGTGSTYGDLPIWGGLSFIFGLIFLFSILPIDINKN